MLCVEMLGPLVVVGVGANKNTIFLYNKEDKKLSSFFYSILILTSFI